MNLFVYALFDPREPDAVRYIGLSVNCQKRLASHVSEAKKPTRFTHKVNWMSASAKARCQVTA